ncbi:MAG: vWA domain-containing protein [Polyangiales bacterium]
MRSHFPLITFGVCALGLSLAACSAGETPPAERTGRVTTPSAAGSGGGLAANPTPGLTPPAATPLPMASSPLPPTDAGTAAPECGRQKFEVERKPADILLVLDRSGSMQNDVNGDDDQGQASKWDLVVPALKQVISATDDKVAWGLMLFPAGDEAGECSEESYPKDIAVPIAPMNAGPVNAAITTATPDGDGTPTGDAVDEALKYLNTVKDMNPKYILLATDGEPSCSGTSEGGDDAREFAVGAVERAAMGGVPTFVVGIATTKDSANETLTNLAMAGGQAPSSGYYLATNQDELVDAMQRITGSVASCRFPLASAPPDPEHVGVQLGTQTVPKDDASQDGWNYVGTTQTEIELFGPACEQVMSGSAQPVNVVFGCKNDPLF